jgi:flagellar export protein FliJ
MKRFSFTLQSILSLKKKIEENEKLKLYALKSELNALTIELEELNSIYSSCSLERRKTSEQGIQISRLAELAAYMDEVDKQKTAKQREIDNKLIQINKQAEVLKQIRMEVKMLEKLKEKQLSEHIEKDNKQNELMIEDFLAGRA